MTEAETDRRCERHCICYVGQQSDSSEAVQRVPACPFGKGKLDGAFRSEEGEEVGR